MLAEQSADAPAAVTVIDAELSALALADSAGSALSREHLRVLFDCDAVLAETLRLALLGVAPLPVSRGGAALLSELLVNGVLGATLREVLWALGDPLRDDVWPLGVLAHVFALVVSQLVSLFDVALSCGGKPPFPECRIVGVSLRPI